MITVPVQSLSSSGEQTEVSMEIPVLDVHEVLTYLYNEVKVQVPAELVQAYHEHLDRVDMPTCPGQRASLVTNQNTLQLVWR